MLTRLRRTWRLFFPGPQIEETYTENDRILPVVASHGNLGDPCVVRVRITEECVYLYIGPRDWQWDRTDGSLVGCGTGLGCPPFPEPHLKLVERRSRTKSSAPREG